MLDLETRCCGDRQLLVMSRKHDFGVQTSLRVYPFVLKEMAVAVPMCDNKIQTEITVAPNDQSRLFYSMLAFLPYQDINRDAIKTYPLPRKTKLHFHNLSHLSLPSVRNQIIKMSLADDDAISDLAIAMACEDTRSGRKRNVGIQTVLLTRPHILDHDNVASIFIEDATMTDEVYASRVVSATQSRSMSPSIASRESYSLTGQYDEAQGSD